jgi:hypothetical protein
MNPDKYKGVQNCPKSVKKNPQKKWSCQSNLKNAMTWIADDLYHFKIFIAVSRTSKTWLHDLPDAGTGSPPPLRPLRAQHASTAGAGCDVTNVYGRNPPMDRTRMSAAPGLAKYPPLKGIGTRRPDMHSTSTGPGHAFGRTLSAIQGKKRWADFACSKAAQDGEAGNFFMEPPGVGWRTSKKKPPAW